MSSSSPFVVLHGGTSAIARETARLLRASGTRVGLIGRDAERITDVASKLESSHRVAEAGDVAALGAAVESLAEEAGRIDGIVNCAGTVLLKPAHLTSPAEWDETIAVNLTSSFALVRAAGKLMARTGGSVVLVSSAAARIGLANHEAIAAAKAGIEGLVRAAAASYGARGLRFNAVAPGLVETPLTHRITSSDVALKASTAMHVLGRPGQPDEVARAIVFLLAPEQAWLTGQVLGVDGGLGTVRSRG